jgi:hypothetical protein
MRKQILDDSSVAACSQLGASFFAAARARLAEPRAEEGPAGVWWYKSVLQGLYTIMGILMGISWDYIYNMYII